MRARVRRGQLECSINRAFKRAVGYLRPVYLLEESLLRNRWCERSAIPADEARNKGVNDEPATGGVAPAASAISRMCVPHGLSRQ